MKDLHTRITDVIEDHADWIYRCNCGHQGGYSEHLAQVIITELGLTRVTRSQNPPIHRYVTDWRKADDE